MKDLTDFIPGFNVHVTSYPRKIRSRHPPIKIQGIKTELVERIAANVCWDGLGTWREFFLGSGCVLFNIRPRKAVVSDINPHIISFYNALKRREFTARGVQQFLKTHGRKLAEQGGSYYYEMRDAFNSSHDPLHFLFILRSCYNGLMRFNKKGNFNASFCKKNDRFDNALVTKVSNQVRWVSNIIDYNDYTFIEGDWKTFSGDVRPGDYVYLDPPYSSRDTGYFTSWDTGEDLKLLPFMATSTCPVMLSTWKGDESKENPFFKNVIDRVPDVRVVEIEHKYQIGQTEESRNSVVEALLIYERTKLL